MNVLKRWALFGAMAVAVAGTQAYMCSDPSEAPHFAANQPGFAVVELFTSEGCSSCPPADQLIARVQQEDRDQRVYILAFHVDYWDRLGWKDAFSKSQYTRRQYQYAGWLKTSSVYTPEVVVNGAHELVGSDEASLRKAIRDGLEQPSRLSISLSDIRAAAGKLTWKYAVGPAGNKRTLLVALVQKAATTVVRAGENSGRTLSHVQIVRELFSAGIGTDGSGSASMDLPAGIGTRDTELIALVQDDADGKIVGATRAPIP